MTEQYNELLLIALICLFRLILVINFYLLRTCIHTHPVSDQNVRLLLCTNQCVEYGIMTTSYIYKQTITIYLYIYKQLIEINIKIIFFHI